MIGLDVGSISAKMVFFEDNKIKNYRITESHKWKDLLDEIPKDEKIISTGYFRKTVPHNLAVTEITSAIHGVRHFFPDAEVIVDIGGQDTKVIDTRDNSFHINDKCSAGTGAFLELVAKNFNLRIDELGTRSQKAERKAMINNTCAVFALSEMISQLVQGYKIEEVLAGIHFAFSKKMASLIPKSKKIVLIGGTAKNIGIASSIASILNQEICIPEEPQIINALGAIKYALNQ